jgi:hypothetical protein
MASTSVDGIPWDRCPTGAAVKEAVNNLKEGQARVEKGLGDLRKETTDGIRGIREDLQSVNSAQTTQTAGQQATRQTSAIWAKVIYSILGLLLGAASMFAAFQASCGR